MEKSRYQQMALDYAKQYLDRLLDLENYVDERLHSSVNAIVESKLRQLSTAEPPAPAKGTRGA